MQLQNDICSFIALSPNKPNTCYQELIIVGGESVFRSTGLYKISTWKLKGFTIRNCIQSGSPSRKLKRQDPSSKAKLSGMSPASQVKWKRNALMEQEVIKVPQSTEVTLSEEQYKEMSTTIVSRIEEISKDELEMVFAEGDAHGVGAQMWITDKGEQLKQFSEDQARNSKLFPAEIRLVSFVFTYRNW